MWVRVDIERLSLNKQQKKKIRTSDLEAIISVPSLFLTSNIANSAIPFVNIAVQLISTWCIIGKYTFTTRISSNIISRTQRTTQLKTRNYHWYLHLFISRLFKSHCMSDKNVMYWALFHCFSPPPPPYPPPPPKKIDRTVNTEQQHKFLESLNYIFAD